MSTVPFVLTDGIMVYTDAAGLASATGCIVKTPSSNFSLAYKGLVLNFVAGVPFMADPALLAAISAAGQTVT